MSTVLAGLLCVFLVLAGWLGLMLFVAWFVAKYDI